MNQGAFINMFVCDLFNFFSSFLVLCILFFPFSAVNRENYAVSLYAQRHSLPKGEF